jgi:hypothetical protein
MFGASAGLTRLQGAGRLAYADVVTYIHPFPDDFFGNVNGPVKVTPACSSMISPSSAELSACWNAALELTEWRVPPVGREYAVCR